MCRPSLGLEFKRTEFRPKFHYFSRSRSHPVNPSQWLRLALLLCLLAGSSLAYDLTCVNIRVLSSDVYAPSNVRLLLDVKECETNLPVLGLSKANFIATGGELGSSLAAYESEEAQYQLQAGPSNYSVKISLVLDLSGSMTQFIPTIQTAAKSFIYATSSKSVVIGIYAFGGSEVATLCEPSTDVSLLVWTIDNLRNTVPQDRSSNLHGAIIEAMIISHDATFGATSFYTQGVVVLISDGRDIAHQYTRDQASQAVTMSTSSIFIVGVGTSVDIPFLTSIGRDGFYYPGTVSELSRAVMNLVYSAQLEAGDDYLFTLCSPARGGINVVEVGRTNSLCWVSWLVGLDCCLHEFFRCACLSW